MLELSPSEVSIITMVSAAVLALALTYLVSKKFKIPNPNFSLARATSTFFIIWLLWGNIVKVVDTTTANAKIGLFNYLTVNCTKSTNNTWTAQLNWDITAVGITIVVTLIGIALLSFVISRLGDISDRRR